MRCVLIAAAIAIAAAPLFATDTLSFNGGGYYLGIVVSSVSPSIVNIHFGTPSAAEATSLSASDFRVVAFDFRKHVLTLEFTRTDLYPELPAFTLEVKGIKGILRIRGRKISGKFDWTA